MLYFRVFLETFLGSSPEQPVERKTGSVGSTFHCLAPSLTQSTRKSHHSSSSLTQALLSAGPQGQHWPQPSLPVPSLPSIEAAGYWSTPQHVPHTASSILEHGGALEVCMPQSACTPQPEPSPSLLGKAQQDKIYDLAKHLHEPVGAPGHLVLC